MLNDDWDVLPVWVSPMETLSEEAIELLCDADQRPLEAMDTILIRLTRGFND